MIRTAERDWGESAVDLIPGGASTGSKRAAVLHGEQQSGPTHFVRSHGCIVETPEGNRLLDCTMALGAVALGYADPDVDAAVIAAIREGTVSALSPVREVELAERLIDMISCAEQVRFLKTGAEAGAAAIRLARVATGRMHVIACGYFGWLDWSSDASGVPEVDRALLHRVPFNDRDALARAVTYVASLPDGLAAIIVEPIVETLASPEWFADIRSLCDRHGAVFVLDEVKTGFRIRPGGVQELLSLSPDLAVFGKAMANGYPLAAVVGRAAIMAGAERSWISSTLASETSALAAALAVMHRHDQRDVCGELALIGDAMCDALRRALDAAGIRDLEVVGPPQMWGVRGPKLDRRDALQRALLEHNVLLKRGFYNFASLAHDETMRATFADAAYRAAQAMERAS
jgi:glutamate-1-semialdehyde 2,1-aminomutase